MSQSSSSTGGHFQFGGEPKRMISTKAISMADGFFTDFSDRGFSRDLLSEEESSQGSPLCHRLLLNSAVRNIVPLPLSSFFFFVVRVDFEVSKVPSLQRTGGVEKISQQRRLGFALDPRRVPSPPPPERQRQTVTKQPAKVPRLQPSPLEEVIGGAVGSIANSH